MKKRSEAKIIHPFQHLQSELAKLIGNTKPGERLPAEPNLAKQLGVSRATLREAMRSFEGQGLIRRRQGVGTFVVDRPRVIDTGLEVLESIETLAAKTGLNVAMGDLRVAETRATAEQAMQLEVAEGIPLVRVSRVIQAEKRPVAYLIDLLPRDVLTPARLQDGFTGSVLDLLLRDPAVSLANSITQVQAVAAAGDVARALEIQRGDVLLLFTAQLLTTAGRVIDLSWSYFLPGYFKFHVLRRVGGSGVRV